MGEAMKHVENALELEPTNAKSLYIKSCILAGVGKVAAIKLIPLTLL